MPIGLTRAQILKRMPNLKPGSFDNYRLRAGIQIIEKRPNKNSPHLTEYLYSGDAIKKLNSIMAKKGK